MRRLAKSLLAVAVAVITASCAGRPIPEPATPQHGALSARVNYYFDTYFLGARERSISWMRMWGEISGSIILARVEGDEIKGDVQHLYLSHKKSNQGNWIYVLNLEPGDYVLLGFAKFEQQPHSYNPIGRENSTSVQSATDSVRFNLQAFAYFDTRNGTLPRISVRAGEIAFLGTVFTRCEVVERNEVDPGVGRVMSILSGLPEEEAGRTRRDGAPYVRVGVSDFALQMTLLLLPGVLPKPANEIAVCSLREVDQSNIDQFYIDTRPVFRGSGWEAVLEQQRRIHQSRTR